MAKKKTGFVDSDSEYFNIINAARIKEIPIEDEYNTDMYSQDLDQNLLYILRDELNNYKKILLPQRFHRHDRKIHYVRIMSKI